MMFTIALGSSLSQNQHEQGGSDSSAYKSANTTQEGRFKANIKTSYTPIEPKANPKPERNEWRDERGLFAQTQATKWAGWMLVVSICMALLSAFGLGTIIWTLRETRKAGEKLSEQNATALKASKAEFQPYLTFSEQVKVLGINKQITGGLPTRAVVKITDKSLDIGGSIEIKNEGKTPANNIFWVISGTMRRGDDEHTIFDNGTHSYLGAGKTKRLKILEKIFIDSESVRIDIADWRFTINLRLSFFDTFDIKKRRVFMANYSGGAVSSETLGNYFSPLYLEEYAEVEAEERDYPENHYT